jgi:2-hydroxy-3-keto-5-methylthiopentenyl-1-phosphate phosphatase
MPSVFLCDFDGTISPSDIGAAFARRFSPGGAAESPEFLARWMHGEMGHRELTLAQCELLRVTREEAMAFARDFTIDPHFAPFAREVEARGDAVAVVSEGLDFYVRDLMERAGLGDLPWSANVLRFEGDRVTPEFPAAADGCGRCGNCKGGHVRAWRARGFRTVLVGDGLSDRCGAREADRVIARRDLLAWCGREGIPVTPFEDFADVAVAVRPPHVAAPGTAYAPPARAAGGA